MLACLGFNRKYNIKSLLKSKFKESIPDIIYYNHRSDGTLPGRTKSYFTKYDIRTINNLIVTNVLGCIYKVKHFQLELLQSVRKKLQKMCPVQVQHNHDTMAYLI